MNIDEVKTAALLLTDTEQKDLCDFVMTEINKREHALVEAAYTDEERVERCRRILIIAILEASRTRCDKIVATRFVRDNGDAFIRICFSKDDGSYMYSEHTPISAFDNLCLAFKKLSNGPLFNDDRTGFFEIAAFSRDLSVRFDICKIKDDDPRLFSISIMNGK
jgi:hypothetical protein